GHPLGERERARGRRAVDREAHPARVGVDQLGHLVDEPVRGNRCDLHGLLATAGTPPRRRRSAPARRPGRDRRGGARRAAAAGPSSGPAGPPARAAVAAPPPRAPCPRGRARAGAPPPPARRSGGAVHRRPSGFPVRSVGVVVACSTRHSTPWHRTAPPAPPSPARCGSSRRWPPRVTGSPPTI